MDAENNKELLKNITYTSTNLVLLPKNVKKIKYYIKIKCVKNNR